MTQTREEWIAGLREAADIFEANPELEAPYVPMEIHVFVTTKEELLAKAKAFGGTWDKGAYSDYYWLRRQVGCFHYEINIRRARVCRRIVTGTRVETKQVEDVEWVCEDSLLEAVLRTRKATAIN